MSHIGTVELLHVSILPDWIIKLYQWHTLDGAIEFATQNYRQFKSSE